MTRLGRYRTTSTDHPRWREVDVTTASARIGQKRRKERCGRVQLSIRFRTGKWRSKANVRKTTNLVRTLNVLSDNHRSLVQRRLAIYGHSDQLAQLMISYTSLYSLLLSKITCNIGKAECWRRNHYGLVPRYIWKPMSLRNKLGSKNEIRTKSIRTQVTSTVNIDPRLKSICVRSCVFTEACFELSFFSYYELLQVPTFVLHVNTYISPSKWLLKW